MLSPWRRCHLLHHSSPYSHFNFQAMPFINVFVIIFGMITKETKIDSFPQMFIKNDCKIRVRCFESIDKYLVFLLIFPIWSFDEFYCAFSIRKSFWLNCFKWHCIYKKIYFNWQFSFSYRCYWKKDWDSIFSYRILHEFFFLRTIFVLFHLMNWTYEWTIFLYYLY